MQVQFFMESDAYKSYSDNFVRDERVLWVWYTATDYRSIYVIISSYSRVLICVEYNVSYLMPDVYEYDVNYWINPTTNIIISRVLSGIDVAVNVDTLHQIALNIKNLLSELRVL